MAVNWKEVKPCSHCGHPLLLEKLFSTTVVDAYERQATLRCSNTAGCGQVAILYGRSCFQQKGLPELREQLTAWASAWARGGAMPGTYEAVKEQQKEQRVEELQELVDAGGANLRDAQELKDLREMPVGAAVQQFPLVGVCSVCQTAVHDTPSGTCCLNGHGGAPYKALPDGTSAPAGLEVGEAKIITSQIEIAPAVLVGVLKHVSSSVDESTVHEVVAPADGAPEFPPKEAGQGEASGPGDTTRRVPQQAALAARRQELIESGSAKIGTLWQPPLLKRFVGSKASSLTRIMPKIPRSFDHYYEPFLGGGAVAFALLGERHVGVRHFKRAVLSDSNERLIRCYRGVRDDIEAVLEGLRVTAALYEGNPEGTYENARALSYKQWRGTQWDIDGGSDVGVAVWFLFLNATCWNGVYRVNKDGEYNVPVGRQGGRLYKRDDGKGAPLPFEVDEKRLRQCSELLQGVELFARNSLLPSPGWAFDWTTAADGDVVMIDPPYAPLSETSDFGSKKGSYGGAGFGAEEQQALATLCQRVARAGATLLVSNHDTLGVREMYRDTFVFEGIPVRRSVNSKAEKRGAVAELLCYANTEVSLDEVPPKVLPLVEEALATSGALSTLSPEAYAAEVGPRILAPDFSTATATATSEGESPVTANAPIATSSATNVAASPAVYIVRVESNLKSHDGQPWIQELGPRTLLYGPRGAGKSRVQQAIELCLKSRVDDVAQRDVKLPAELRSLAPGRNGPLFVRLTLSNGDECTWSLAAEDGRPKVGWSAGTPATLPVLPMADVLEALRAGVDKSRAFFLEKLESGISERDVTGLISETRMDLYKGATVNVSAGTSPVGKLLAAIEFSKARVREIQTELKEAEFTVSTAPAVPPSAEGVAQLEAQQVALQLQVKGHVLARVKQELAELHAWRAFLAQLPAEPAAVSGEEARATAEWEAQVQALGATLQLAVNKGLTQCPCCDAAVAPGRFEAQLGAFMQSWNDYLTTKTAKQGPATYAVTLGDGRVEQMTREDVRLRAERVVSLPHGFTEADLESVPTPTMPYQEADEALTRVSRALLEAKGHLARWADVMRAREVVAKADERKGKWNGLLATCEDARDRLLMREADSFCKRVQRYMPKGEHFGLMLREGDRETLRVGLWSLGTGEVGQPGSFLRTALSGAEETMVLLAISCALSEGGAGGRSAGPAILMPRERAYDPDTLREMMRALQKAPCQVLLTSPVKPSSRGSKTWAEIELKRVGGSSAGSVDSEDGSEVEHNGEGEKNRNVESGMGEAK